jgi:hypothetical protein
MDERTLAALARLFQRRGIEALTYSDVRLDDNDRVALFHYINNQRSKDNDEHPHAGGD